jgi:hypothetical protein
MPPPQLRVFAMDWKAVLALWSKSEGEQQPNPSLLEDVFSEMWFGLDKLGQRRFHVGLVV